MTFTDAPTTAHRVEVIVGHSFTGDIDALRDDVSARLGQPVTVRREKPPPAEHEPRVTVTSGPARTQ